MKVMLFICVFLFTGALCLGDTNKLHEAIQSRNQTQVRQVLKDLGSLSLYNKRTAEEAAQVIIAELQKENQDQTSKSSTTVLLSITGALATIALLTIIAKSKDSCCICGGGSVFGAVLVAFASNALVNLLDSRDESARSERLIDDARMILKIIKDTPTA